MSGKQCPECAKLRRSQSLKATFSQKNSNEIKQVKPVTIVNKLPQKPKPAPTVTIVTKITSSSQVSPVTKAKSPTVNPSITRVIPHTCNGLSEIENYIRSIYTGNILLKDTSETTTAIDIYLPDIKIGFNFNELYAHSEGFCPKKTHYNELIEAENKGIRLVHIFEDEWEHKKEICKDKIANIIGCSPNPVVYARQCKIVDNITSQEKNNFFNKYHVQGQDSAGIICGLEYKGEVIAMMTFAKPRLCLGRKNTTYISGEYELSRFASSCNVPGGFSRLMKYAIKKYNINIINTFADLRWSGLSRNVYAKNGFTQKSISEPNYWYFSVAGNVVDTHRKHRFNFRKQELPKKLKTFDNAKTEYANMCENDYCRIWDCGNIVFQWVNPNYKAEENAE